MFVSKFLFNFVLIAWVYEIVLEKFLESSFLKIFFFLPFYFNKHRNFRSAIRNSTEIDRQLISVGMFAPFGPFNKGYV